MSAACRVADELDQVLLSCCIKNTISETLLIWLRDNQVVITDNPKIGFFNFDFNDLVCRLYKAIVCNRREVDLNKKEAQYLSKVMLDTLDGTYKGLDDNLEILITQPSDDFDLEKEELEKVKSIYNKMQLLLKS